MFDQELKSHKDQMEDQEIEMSVKQGHNVQREGQNVQPRHQTRLQGPRGRP